MKDLKFNNMTVELLADRINQLIDVTEELILYLKQCEHLYKKYRPNESAHADYAISEIPSMLRFLHSMFFYDVLLNINTLLDKVDKDPNKKEQSIYELSEFLQDEFIKEEILNKSDSLRFKFENYNLHIFRHKLAAHKDWIAAGDTTIMYLHFIKPEIISVCEEITKELKQICIKYFDVITTNSFHQLYNKGFQKMLKLFEDELIK